MSLFALHLAAEIRAARKALQGSEASPRAADLAAAADRAAACLADLERAERLLESERRSAEAAQRALDRATDLFQIQQAEQRLADEAADLAEESIRAASGSAGARGYLPSAEGCAEFAADEAERKEGGAL